MKYRWKKLVALSLTACLFGTSMTGCSFSPTDKTETKLDMPEPIEDESDNEADAGSSENTDNKTDADSSEGTDNETETDAFSDSANSEDENPPESSGKWHVYDADLAAAVDADFEGCVQKTDTNSFLITPSTTILEEDGSLTMAVSADGADTSDEELAQVVFDENTTFILRDIYDGGARYEDSDVSFQSIEKGSFVSLKGEFQNDVFHANMVRINKSH